MIDSSLKRSGMARVNDGSHSFTCHPHVMRPTMLPLRHVATYYNYMSVHVDFGFVSQAFI